MVLEALERSRKPRPRKVKPLYRWPEDLLESSERSIGGFARAFEPRSSTGAVRGSLSPEGSPVWGPYGGGPLLAGAWGRVPSPPT